MTVTACYQLVSPSHCRERCIGCGGKSCVCCGGKGWHYDAGAAQQRNNVNNRFAQSGKDRLFAK